MKKNKYIIIAIVATVILLIGIVYLVKDNNSIFNNKIDIYNNENSNNDEVSILLEDNNIKVNGSGVSINGNTVTITKAGMYRFNGSLSDGQIIVDTTKNDEVTISNTISNLGKTGGMGNGMGNGMGGRGGMMQRPPIR